jgi:hypothetical protein
MAFYQLLHDQAMIVSKRMSNRYVQVIAYWLCCMTGLRQQPDCLECKTWDKTCSDGAADGRATRRLVAREAETCHADEKACHLNRWPASTKGSRSQSAKCDIIQSGHGSRCPDCARRTSSHSSTRTTISTRTWLGQRVERRKQRLCRSGSRPSAS